MLLLNNGKLHKDGEGNTMRTVYLVDDDRLVLDKYWSRRRLFFESGFEIIGGETNPVKALEEIRSLHPDAVFSDLKMPDLTGIGLLEELKRDVFQPLFVIVSAYDEYNEVRKLFLSNGFDYLIKPVADCELVNLLNRLAGKIDYILPKVENQTPSNKLNEILQYMKDYSNMNLMLETISERFKISSGTVCNLFTKHLDTTFSAHLCALRMERAKTLLRTTDKQIKEIAVNCGYSDALYFTRVFHKINGVSPSRFRENGGT